MSFTWAGEVWLAAFFWSMFLRERIHSLPKTPSFSPPGLFRGQASLAPEDTW
jgi:hypothetical protein